MTPKLLVVSIAGFLPKNTVLCGILTRSAAEATAWDLSLTLRVPI
jgi:hypothetical protein